VRRRGEGAEGLSDEGKGAGRRGLSTASAEGSRRRSQAMLTGRRRGVGLDDPQRSLPTPTIL